jgi:ParB family chromosome partitioning protein
MSAQRGLGRGLSALIPKTAAGAGVETVDIDLITPNPHQPRASFEPGALRELAESIREHGVLQPIVVTLADSGMGPTTYQLIAGERRLQAARMAGVTRMPVVVREAAGHELLEIALVENLLREDLNPLEEAQAFRRLHDEFSMTQEHIARRIGRSRGAVANTLRLLALPREIQESIRSGQISEGHARALLSIDDPQLRLDVWRKIVSDELTVRQAEEIARSLRSGTRGRKAAKVRRVDPHVRALEDDLRRRLGTPVAVRKGARGGSIVIRFHSDEELEGIIEKIAR